MWTIIVVYMNLFKMKKKKIIVSSYFYLELDHRRNEE